MASPSAGQPTQLHAHLYLLGAGVAFPHHLTLQSIEILQSCNSIYTNLTQPDLDLMPDDLKSRCVGLWSLYQENRDRSLNYCDVARAIVEATSSQPPIGWLTPGHPLVFDSVSQMLLKAGHEHGWNVCVVPAISCVDTVLAQVGYDPAHGLVMHEATALVVRRLPLIPACASLLLQPSAFGSDVAKYTTRTVPDLSLLRDYLLQFYEAHHKCAFVRSYSRAAGPDQVYWTDLSQICSVSFEILAAATLFIPPAPGEGALQ